MVFIHDGISVAASPSVVPSKPVSPSPAAGTTSTPVCIRYCMPDTNVVSSIAPSAHHPALVFIHDGISAASVLGAGSSASPGGVPPAGAPGPISMSPDPIPEYVGS